MSHVPWGADLAEALTGKATPAIAAALSLMPIADVLLTDDFVVTASSP
jgi:hypothetical protein